MPTYSISRRFAADGTLHCGRCKRYLPVTAFWPAPTKAGYYGYCKGCEKERKAGYCNPNPNPRAPLERTDDVRARARIAAQRWRERHLPAYRAYQRAYQKKWHRARRAQGILRVNSRTKPGQP